MEYKANIHDAIKVEAFDKMVRAWDSPASEAVKAKCLVTIMEQTLEITGGKDNG